MAKDKRRILFVTDYDNTLEIHHNFVLEKEQILYNNIESLNKLREKNNVLVIATGRNFNGIYNTVLERKINFDYLCCNNGAEIYDKNLKLIHVDQLQPNSIKYINVIYSKTNCNKKIYYRYSYNQKHLTSISMYIYSKLNFDVFVKSLKSADHEILIYENFPKIKIIGKNVDKANSIKYIIHHLKCSLEKWRIVTIGDDMNDLQMIKKYEGYTMPWGNEILKKNCNKVYEKLYDLVDDLLVLK